MNDLASRTEAGKRAVETYDRHPNLVARLDSRRGPVVIKWFGWRSRLNRALSPFTLGRAWTSWEVAHALRNADVRTPEPLYVFARRRRGVIHDNFFVTAAIHPHTTLRALLKSDTPQALMEQAVSDLAHSIARMHGVGIFHRDLTTGNFLVDGDGLVHIVDLNRARRRPRLSPRRRLVDLARLSFTARDSDISRRLRHTFFQVYATGVDARMDWEGGYARYRRRRLARRRWKLGLRRLLGGK